LNGLTLTFFEASSHVLFIPYEKSDSADEGLVYNGVQVIKDLELPKFKKALVIDPLIQHTFPSSQQTWRPSKLTVNGRKGRRVLCASSQDRLRYVLFDIDSGRDVDGESEGGQDSEHNPDDQDDNEMPM
jgi:hypothetical protein